MKYILPSWLLFLFLLLLAPNLSDAQNLIPNPGFEILSSCPFGPGTWGPTPAISWMGPTLGTPDIFNSCANFGQAGVPVNFAGSQTAHGGEGYAGVYVKGPGTVYREYLQASLMQPLTAGKLYSVSFYVSQGEFSCASENIGIYFSAMDPNEFGTGILPVTPQVTSDLGFLDDTQEWTLISGCFTAQGGEQFVTIGNFASDLQTPLQLPCADMWSYYYVDDVSLVEITPVEPLNFGADITLCTGQQVFLHANNLGADFLWQDNSTDESFLVTSTGSYYLQISNACSVVSDTINVTFIDNTPQVALPGQVSLCAGETITLDAGIIDADYLWSNNSQNQRILVTSPGVYMVTVTNACGNGADTTIVTDGGQAPAIALGTDLQLCAGETILLQPDFSDVDTWIWQDGSSDPTFTITNPGEVHVAVTNACGTAYDTLQATLQAAIPLLDLGPDIEGCLGETVTIESGIVDVNHLWQDGSINPEFTTTQSGILVLEISNHCGSATDTIEVNLTGALPTPALPADTTLCEGTSLFLASNADAETSIEWQDGSTAPTFEVTIPGLYILSEINLCGEALDTIVVSYLQAPDLFFLGADTTLCAGETILLSSPSSFYDVLWQDGSGMLHLVADQPGTFSLQLSNDCGVAFDEIEISYDTDIPQLNLDATIPWCEGEIITLDATQTFIATYAWNTGSDASLIEVQTPGLYSIEVASRCKTISHVVEVYPDPDCNVDINEDIYIPNIFSPDENGVNDLFFVSFGSDLEVTSMEGSIFDRWGNLVFTSQENSFQWDGLFANEVALPGVYVYLIKYTYMDGSVEREKAVSGDLTLVR